MTAPILNVSGLQVFYGDVAVVRGVDFHVPQGGVTVLLGANGAGKTTVLRAISGLARRYGAIYFDGRAIEHALPHSIARLGIAHVPDDRGTFLELDVDENLRLGAIARRDTAEVQADFDFAFELFPRLRERRSQQAGTLSGGEQQMLAIARALMLRPRLLLLDEPSFGLAPMIVEEIYEILQRIRVLREIGILLVEQNAEVALDIAEHVFLLETGRVVLAGPPHLMRDDPRVQEAYLGCK
ncbi:ABC transporter ATP-binding protein [Bradyrhizobium sp. 33ap4]|uniref:ABC transporter ATP-binding protein n=1 Tax=Bradyrhizobium sp. 33ap4 TaxID=3061630 RepID=UPI00292EEC02|nr:ABC transporter ATP-binding protein [Bradyrhizobium sp. 33ap4]